MSSASEWQTIAQIYRLIGDCLLGPIDSVLVERFWRLPTFRQALVQWSSAPILKSNEGLLESENLPKKAADQLVDELANQHYSTFGRQWAPYASIYLSPEGFLGGAISSEYQEDYAHFSFQPRNLQQESPDHLGLQVLFLSFLLGELGQAERQQDLTSANSIKIVQRCFLRDRVWSWFPIYLTSFRRTGRGFYRVLLDLLHELLVEQQKWLNQQEVLGPIPSTANLQKISELPLPDLEDPNTNLRQIAQFILHPGRSGLFLSLDDLARIGRQMELPRGFSGREDMFLNLAQSASEYELWPELIDMLKREVRAFGSDLFTEFTQLKVTDPWFEEVSTCWQSRLETTAMFLEKMAKALETSRWSTTPHENQTTF